MPPLRGAKPVRDEPGLREAMSQAAPGKGAVQSILNLPPAI